MQLSDSSGSIEMVAFNQLTVLSSIESMKLDNVYMISYPDVKEMSLGCQKWPARNGSAYELHFTNATEIDFIDEPPTAYIFKEATHNEDLKSQCLVPNVASHLIPPMHSKYSNYVSLSLLDTLKPDSLINVLGLITHVDTEVRKLPNKDDLSIHNFKIIDTTSESVSVAVWGKEAEEFFFEVGDIIDIAKCKLTNYGGKSLSVLWSTTLRRIEVLYDITPEVSNLVAYAQNVNQKRKHKDSIDFSNKLSKSDMHQ